MNALPAVNPARAGVALVVLGVGGVGRALLELLATPAAGALQLVAIADSTRQWVNPRGIVPARARRLLAASVQPRDDEALLGALRDSGLVEQVIVDATASSAVAAHHADWLARGCHVVSANKAALGERLEGWQRLRHASRLGRRRYGDAATVGAGLPVLSTLLRLCQCGDRLRALDGVFSGSLSWLFNNFDGSRPFSALLHEARQRGYTEPDPRLDLGGADVARKLLILARAAGHAIDAHEVHVESLVPGGLREVTVEAFLARASELDAPLEQRRAQAAREGRLLRLLARLDSQGRASVGLVAVEPTHPAARLAGNDNLFALTTVRYHDQPLVIQGPGAGAEVTAQALLGDVLALTADR
ncbi:MAG: homoserine dehydrogenase [Dokdonella sp.]|uniref:homoserine dehydrogenase n=1 Tax=Dokdonella sp. TaxID=2291710 RepID=UPI0025C43734|nr:homoserine dehydrogenase [Dokdonella sp.]MBX3700978.1 homoserine dehydrogenase [Dokdonella sp.]